MGLRDPQKLDSEQSECVYVCILKKRVRGFPWIPKEFCDLERTESHYDWRGTQQRAVGK